MGRTVLVNAGPWLPVPPPAEGGVENVIADLVAGLRRRGARVVLATVAESTVETDEKLWLFREGQYRRVSGRPYNTVSGIPHAHMLRVAERLRRGDIDVLHDHMEVVGPSMCSALGERCPPVLHTLHWQLDRHTDFYDAFDGRGRIFCNALSASHLAQAGANLRRQIVGVVPNGIDPAAFPFQRDKEDYLVVLGRVAETKGQDIAARICDERGLELVLAGPIAGISSTEQFQATLDDPAGDLRSRPAARYYLERVLPHVDGRRIRWIGSVGGAAKLELLSRARAMLMPVRWDEPFGLVVIEAMACGTPVVALDRGNLRGLVEHGVNGFLAGDEAELAACLERLDEIDPAACRQTVESRFSTEHMTEAYEALYERVISLAADRAGG